MEPHAAGMPLSFLPSPPDNGFYVGPLFVHFYGLMYVVGIALAIYITRRRWQAAGGAPALVADVATWAVPAGIIGGRIYFDITTPGDIPPHWWGVFAVWSGGLGIWGGIAAGAAAGIWRVRRTGASAAVFANAIAPALLVAQAVGRVGNYFNQELFGHPSTLPWALEISRPHRPDGYGAFATFQPTFLYEIIWDLALAALLVWLGHHRRIRPPGLFALYVAGYSAFRIFEESLRIDSSEHFLGLRLNFYVATAGVIAGLVWFVLIQRRTGPFPSAMPPPDDSGEPEAAGPAGSAGADDGRGTDGGTGDDADAGQGAGRSGSGGQGSQPPGPGGASAVSARAADK
ncbi:MAG TPA: prolipoprotein diacylglyceryl transferase [Streptosporangiaceae bacterium]|nr:prolipoprotein diacylglyceryl transferase [Streptosporangiaceae bacterium]